MPYYEDDYTWCVARAKVRPKWQNFYHIIRDDIVFVVMTIVAIIAHVLIFLLSAFERKPLDLWKVVCYFASTMYNLGGSFEPQNHRIRFLIAIYLMICLWLDTIFIAFIIKFCSTSFTEKQVRTTTELVEHNYKLLASKELFDEIVQQKMVCYLLIIKIFLLFLLCRLNYLIDSIYGTEFS